MSRKGENIYERRDGRWEARYISGRRADGRAIYTSVYESSYTKVREKRSQALAALSSQKPVCKLTIKELCGQWLGQARNTVKESSYCRYEHIVKKHILPELGTLQADALTANALRNFSSRKIEKGRLDGRGGLSEKTVQDMVIIVKSVMKLAALEYGLQNRTEAVKPPRAEPPEINVLNEVELQRLERRLQDTPDNSSAGIRLSLRLGLRLGEVCGLRWSDIDWKRQIVHVRKTAQRVYRTASGTGSKSQLTLTSPKTRRSVREIPLPPDLFTYLRRIAQGQKTDAFIATGKEQLMDPRTYQYRFKSLLKKLEIRSVSFHTLRHTFATLCIQQKMDVKTLSGILGHSSVSMTLNRYVHTTEANMRHQMENLRFVC